MTDPFQELREDVLFEETQIKVTIDCILKVKVQFPPADKDYTLEPAMGTYLMNFYNGLENMLKRIAKVYYRTILTGESWHKDLLDLSFTPPQGKIPVFSQNVVHRLYRYKNFRHRFVSGYGFQLKAEKMNTLIDDVESLWADIQRELQIFFEKLSSPQ